MVQDFSHQQYYFRSIHGFLPSSMTWRFENRKGRSNLPSLDPILAFVRNEADPRIGLFFGFNPGSPSRPNGLLPLVGSGILATIGSSLQDQPRIVWSAGLLGINVSVWFIRSSSAGLPKIVCLFLTLDSGFMIQFASIFMAIQGGPPKK